MISCCFLLVDCQRKYVYSMPNKISFLCLKDVFVVKFKEAFYHPPELEF